MSKTFTIFLSGQVSGLKTKKAMLNFLSAKLKVENNIKDWTLPVYGRLERDTEIFVINPLDFVPMGASDKVAMSILLPLLCDCDLIACLENSNFSGGSKVERTLASYLNIPIIYLNEY